MGILIMPISRSFTGQNIKDLKKTKYFTNLDFPEIRGTHLDSIRHSPCTFPEIRGFPLLKHHLGEIGRVRSL